MSAATLNDMLGNVNTIMERSMIDSLKFAPETLLRRLTTPEAVKKVLQEYSTEVRLTQNFYRKGFRDDMLPVRKRRLEQDSMTWEIESCNKRAFDGNRVPEVFRWGPSSPWGRDSYRVDQFCQHWQWPFVPPVFVVGNFRYIFPEETRLPFTRSGEKKDSDATTLYSYVEKMSVHASHLPKNPVRCLSFLLNSFRRLREC
jgi:hypothetical protein